MIINKSNFFVISAQPSQFWFSNPGANVWRSTGLYAKAGTVVTITVPDSTIGKLGVSVIIYLELIEPILRKLY
jgi:hypothetical protein